MINITCEVMEDYESGAVGLVPDMFRAWFRNGAFIPTTALGHDLVSHTNNESGSISDELKALGCELWLSDMYSSLITYSSPSYVFANDIVSSLVDWLREHSEVPQLTKKFHLDEETIEEITNIFDDGLKTLISGIQYEFDEDEADQLAQATDYVARNRQSMLEWLCYGYWYASKKRYRGQHPSQLFYLKKKIDEACNWVDMTEGLRYRISYNLQGYVKVHDITDFS